MNLAYPIQELLASSSVPLLSALLLGVLVALSPCPLSTNLGALAYIGRRATRPSDVLLAGILYTAGRIVAYTLLVGLLVIAGIEAGQTSSLLQGAGKYLLGPGLVLAGLVVLRVIPLRLPAGLGGRIGLGERLAGLGPMGAFGLGALFALAFCPYSAALFFGALMPLALGPSGGVALAPAFAIGTGLPVIVAALLLTTGVSGLSRWFAATSRAEPVLRWGAGIVLMAAGLYAIVAWLPL